MIGLLSIWAALLAALVFLVIGRPREGGALTLAYFIGLSLIHVPGAVVCLGAGVSAVDRDITQLGFETTVLGMGAFVVGAVFSRRSEWRRVPRDVGRSSHPGETFERPGWHTIAIGVGAYFVLLPISTAVPSLTSIVSATATLLILGLWLLLYDAVAKADQKRLLLTLCLLPLLPLATLVTGGFLGYGVYWVLSVVAFLFIIVRDRSWFYLAAPAAVYLGLSLFVSYMQQRADIREAVWLEQSSLGDRLERVAKIFTQFELVDLESPAHVDAINGRLNQNLLVGLGIIRHDAGAVNFAFGATVPLWALIPRVIWPDKPEVGGSGDVVGDFTGVHFAHGTSVGIGQVLEFYINFGIPGVILGFALLGFALPRLDFGIMRALAARDGRGLLLRAMPGLTLLQPGGSLLEMLVAFVAALVAARMILSFNLFRISAGARVRQITA